MAVSSKCAQWQRHTFGLAWILRTGALLFLGLNTTVAQTQRSDWQVQIRALVRQQDWVSAMRIAEQQIERTPSDPDVLAWRARILMWSGHLTEAEAEYLNMLKLSQKGPDIWLGLANVYVRE